MKFSRWMGVTGFVGGMNFITTLRFIENGETGFAIFSGVATICSVLILIFAKGCK